MHFWIPLAARMAQSVHRRAAKVENRVYKVMTALVAPPETTLPSAVGEAYKPFDHIERIRVHIGGEASYRDLVPLAIFDDAHVLHPDQFRAFERFLVRRELRIARSDYRPVRCSFTGRGPGCRY